MFLNIKESFVFLKDLSQREKSILKSNGSRSPRKQLIFKLDLNTALRRLEPPGLLSENKEWYVCRYIMRFEYPDLGWLRVLEKIPVPNCNCSGHLETLERGDGITWNWWLSSATRFSSNPALIFVHLPNTVG